MLWQLIWLAEHVCLPSELLLDLLWQLLRQLVQCRPWLLVLGKCSGNCSGKCSGKSSGKCAQILASAGLLPRSQAAVFTGFLPELTKLALFIFKLACRGDLKRHGEEHEATRRGQTHELVGS